MEATNISKGDLVFLLAKEILLNHSPADGVIEVLILLERFKSNRTVDLLEVSVPRPLC